MVQTPYTNREIDEHFKGVTATLARIEEQTTRTNGRVTQLEIWRGVLIGAWAIIALIVLPLISFTYIRQVEELKDIIKNNTNAISEINNN